MFPSPPSPVLYFCRDPAKQKSGTAPKESLRDKKRRRGEVIQIFRFCSPLLTGEGLGVRLYLFPSPPSPVLYSCRDPAKQKSGTAPKESLRDKKRRRGEVFQIFRFCSLLLTGEGLGVRLYFFPLPPSPVLYFCRDPAKQKSGTAPKESLRDKKRRRGEVIQILRFCSPLLAGELLQRSHFVAPAVRRVRGKVYFIPNTANILPEPDLSLRYE